jgi:uncharacterized protein YjeT (DUF2065 family)
LSEASLETLTRFAGAVVVLSAAYLVGFGVLAIARRSSAIRYLRRFASTFRLHILELCVRCAIGAAFIGYASRMQLPGVFRAFGIVLVATTLGLALIPWRWHQRIAQATVPRVERYLPLLGIAAVAAGVFVLWAVTARLLG